MRWDLNAPTTLTIGGDVISFQAVIYEGSGNIEFIYKPESRNVNNGSASVGITAVGTGSGNFMSINSIASASPTSSTTTETTNINTKPASVRSIALNPEKAAAPTGLNFTEVGATGIRLNWTDNASDELGFAIYRSTDNTNFTYISQTAANVATFSDIGLTGGVTYYYRVYAIRESLSDLVSGNQLTSCQSFSLANIPLGNIVANYKLNANANDFYGANNGTLQGAPTAITNRFNIANTAYQFNGTTQYVSTATSFLNPSVFTISVWFKTAVGGGKLIGFGSNQTGFSASADRHIYMNNSGQLYFGAKPGGVFKSINSSASYADGNWHMATATMSASGIVLYVDGVSVAQDATTTSGENYTGYWRLAYDNIDGWPSVPANRFFSGSLDDAFIYSRALNATEVMALYNAGEGVGSNGPVCAGTNLVLTANTIDGAAYAWTGPNSFVSSAQNPTLTYSDAAKGVYTVTVNRNGCTVTASTTVSSIGEGRWTGNASSNWLTANNWCNGIVPTSTVNVSVPSSGVVNNPTLTGTGNVNNIDVQSGRTLTIGSGGNLQVMAAITNSGTIVVTSGKVSFNGTAAQVIPANVFSNNTIMDLTLNNTAGVTLSGSLRLTGVLTASAGVFNANGFLTLASNATSTAGVAEIPVGASVQGQVKVERFVKGGAIEPYRTNRMFSSPVYDNTTSFINANVEGNRSAKFSQFIDDIIVSGTQGATGNFDVTHNNQVGAWTYSSGFIAIPHINTAVNAGRGMFVFFRGNRDNFIQKTTAPYVNPENTIIDFEGVLNQRDITVNLPLGGHFLGNPYAATIDWDSPNWGADRVNVNGTIWIWNPVTRSYATYNNGVGLLGGSKYIASGQSFFVQTSAAGSIKFKENIKAVAQQPPTLLMSVGRNDHNITEMSLNETQAEPRSMLRVAMKPLASYGEDETVIVFNEGSSSDYNQEDALHFDGEVVNVSTLANSRKLAINFLPVPSQSMEIPLHVAAAESGSYTFYFNLDEYFAHHSLLLKDSYLNTLVPIIPNLLHSFNIDRSNSQTFGANRFSIAVAPPVVLPVGLTSFKAEKQNSGVLLTWSTSYEIDHNLYRLYRAANDGKYVLLGDVLSKDTKAYYFLDTSPLPGYNYYKLVQIDNDGQKMETAPLIVNFGVGQLSDMLIYPNPVRDSFTVRINGLTQEKYKLTLFESTGRKLAMYDISKKELDFGYKVNASELELGIFVIKIEEVVTGKIIAVEKLLKN